MAEKIQPGSDAVDNAAAADATDKCADGCQRTDAKASTKAKAKVTAKAKAPQDPFVRAANEDDDGYDPYSDRPARREPLFERDPWA